MPAIKGFLLFFVVETTIAFRFVPEHREVVYEYVGNVNVEAQAPWDELDKAPPEPSGWKVRGTFKLQRIDADTLAAAVRKRQTIYFIFFFFFVLVLSIEKKKGYDLS